MNKNKILSFVDVIYKKMCPDIYLGGSYLNGHLTIKYLYTPNKGDREISEKNIENKNKILKVYKDVVHNLLTSHGVDPYLMVMDGEIWIGSGNRMFD